MMPNQARMVFEDGVDVTEGRDMGVAVVAAQNYIGECHKDVRDGLLIYIKYVIHNVVQAFQ